MRTLTFINAILFVLVGCNNNAFNAPKVDSKSAAHYVESNQPRIKVVSATESSELRVGDSIECYVPMESLDEKAIDENGYHPEAVAQNVFATYFFYSSSNPDVAKAVIQGTKPGLAVARYSLYDGRSNRADIQRPFRGQADKKEESISCKVQLRFEGGAATSLLSDRIKIEDTPPVLKVVSGPLLQKSLLPGQKVLDVRLHATDADGDTTRIVEEKNTCLSGVTFASNKVSGTIPNAFSASRCEVSVVAMSGEVKSEPVTVVYEVFSGVVNSELSNLPAAHSLLENLNVTVGGENVDLYKYALTTQSESCENATYSNSWVQAPTPISAALGADGDKRLCVIGRSENGLEEKKSDASTAIWTKDTVAPVSSDVTLSGLPSGLSTATSLTVALSGDGFSHYRYALSNAGCGNSSNFSSNVEKTVSISENLNSLLDGTVHLCVKAVDLAGNESSIISSSWTKDTTPPIAELSNLPANPSNGSSVNVTVGGTGVSEYQFALISSGTCANATYSSFQSGNLSDTLGADGSYTLCVKAKDAAGNLQSVATSHTWVKDSVAPLVTGFSLTNVPSGTNNVTALNVSVSGAGVTQYQYKLDSTDTCAACGLQCVTVSGQSHHKRPQHYARR